MAYEECTLDGNQSLKVESLDFTIKTGGHLKIGTKLTDVSAFVPPPAELVHAGPRECLEHRSQAMNG